MTLHSILTFTILVLKKEPQCRVNGKAISKSVNAHNKMSTEVVQICGTTNDYE